MLHILLHLKEWHVESLTSGNEDQIPILPYAGKHPGKTCLEPPLAAIAFHCVPDFFGYRKTDLKPFITVSGRDKGEAIGADPFSGSVSKPKFFMPFQGISPIQRKFPQKENARQALL